VSALAAGRARRLTPELVLGALMAVTATLLLWESRGQSFFADEWAFFARYRGLEPEVLLTPDAGNLVVVPALLYKSTIALFGGGTYLPERLLWVALDLSAAGLFYLVARRRVGGWAALAPTTLLLVFGAAHEVLGGPLGITILLTASCGLGSLLLVERRDLPGDAGACLLLAIAIYSYTAGIAFAAGIAVEILFLRGPGGWRRAWVFIVPLIPYAAWRIWALKFHETQVTLDNILSLPSSVAASLAAVTASISGTFRPPGIDGIAGASFDSRPGWTLALVALALVALRLRGRDRRPLDPQVWVFLAIVLSYWVLIGTNFGPLRAPEASRYQYPGAVFLLLFAVQLAAGLRFSWRSGLAIAVLLAAGLAGNVANLHEAAKFLRINSDENRAQLAALELVREHADPGLPVEPLTTAPAPTDDMVVPTGDYLAAADELGSPAYSLDQVTGRSEQVREHADQQLVHSLQLAPRAEPAPPAAAAAAGPSLEATDGAVVTGRGACRRIAPQLGGAGAIFALQPGGFTIEPGPGADPHLALRRFGEDFVAQLPAPAAGALSVVRIPGDGGTDPWHLAITVSAPVTVCSL
jgi:hypothetical protein